VLFRIAQEALTNVAKHAAATQVDVSLTLDAQQARLTVRDNGRGFDTASRRAGAIGDAGWGLLGIEERANLLGGQAVVESSPGAGTQVGVTVPIPAPEEQFRPAPAHETGR
jgi:signal transduction histidine kinase